MDARQKHSGMTSYALMLKSEKSTLMCRTLLVPSC